MINKFDMQQDIERVLYTEKAIAARVEALGIPCSVA